MKWQLTYSCDPFADKRMVIQWNDMDIAFLHLDAFDHALLRECDQSDKLSDKLLALELLARKVEQRSGTNL